MKKQIISIVAGLIALLFAGCATVKETTKVTQSPDGTYVNETNHSSRTVSPFIYVSVHTPRPAQPISRSYVRQVQPAQQTRQAMAVQDDQGRTWR